MKKQHPTEEEFRRLEYAFNESKEDLPEEFVTVIEKSFDLFRPYITKELPLREELAPSLKRLCIGIIRRYIILCRSGNSTG